jgi:short-subunit dehydrogenase
MKPLHLEGRWVVVTGASSGLGREMARQLARDHRANPILVARRRDRLDALRDELVSAYGVSALVIQADLAKPQDVDRVFRESTAHARVDAVILNAGVTYFGPHHELDWSTYESLVATNLTSVMRLTHLFVPYLLAQEQQGALMLVTSVAGLLPTPYQAAYGGTKAFLTTFGQSVAEELHGHGASVTVFAPGGIATEMNHLSGLAAQFEGSVALQAADACAREGLAAMIARRSLAVAGWLNRLQVFVARFVPRKLATVIARIAFRKALAAKEAAPKRIADGDPR